jgi:hypothetical protein
MVGFVTEDLSLRLRGIGFIGATLIGIFTGAAVDETGSGRVSEGLTVDAGTASGLVVVVADWRR